MKKFKPKSKEMINEASDIVANTEDDQSAIEFLRETLDDDFPDLDLGSMNLHEAIEVLGGDKSKKDKNKEAIENLTASLSDFMNKDKNNGKKANKKVSKKTNKKTKKRK